MLAYSIIHIVFQRSCTSASDASSLSARWVSTATLELCLTVPTVTIDVACVAEGSLVGAPLQRRTPCSSQPAYCPRRLKCPASSTLLGPGQARVRQTHISRVSLVRPRDDWECDCGRSGKRYIKSGLRSFARLKNRNNLNLRTVSVLHRSH